MSYAELCSSPTDCTTPRFHDQTEGQSDILLECFQVMGNMCAWLVPVRTCHLIRTLQCMVYLFKQLILDLVRLGLKQPRGTAVDVISSAATTLRGAADTTVIIRCPEPGRLSAQVGR